MTNHGSYDPRQHLRDIVNQGTVEPDELAFWSALNDALDAVDAMDADTATQESTG